MIQLVIVNPTIKHENMNQELNQVNVNLEINRQFKKSENNENNQNYDQNFKEFKDENKENIKPKKKTFLQKLKECLNLKNFYLLDSAIKLNEL